MTPARAGLSRTAEIFSALLAGQKPARPAPLSTGILILALVILCDHVKDHAEDGLSFTFSHDMVSLRLGSRDLIYHLCLK